MPGKKGGVLFCVYPAEGSLSFVDWWLALCDIRKCQVIIPSNTSVLSCSFFWASHCWCSKPFVLVPHLPDIFVLVSSVLFPFLFCLDVPSPQVLICSVSCLLVCPPKNMLRFWDGGFKHRHWRHSQNFPSLCLYPDHYHGLSTLSVITLYILVISIPNSKFCHSNVSALLESGSNTYSDSEFKIFCYWCLPFSVSYVYSNIYNFNKIYFSEESCGLKLRSNTC